MDKELHEECGIFGICQSSDAASLTYFGLHALQHRGQEAAGIASCDEDKLYCYKGKGLLSEVFNQAILDTLPGDNALGHVRYATVHNNQLENVQPIMIRSHSCSFAIAHNGQIVNAIELKDQLEKKGSIFQGSSDSELLAHMIQNESGDFVTKMKKACSKLEGAFAFIIMTKAGLYAIRDKNGLRPLSIALTSDKGYCISSETCAFDIIGAQYLRDVFPGEIVRLSKEGIKSYQYTHEIQYKMCAMEYIYFARPDSIIEGVNVHTARRLSGRALARNEEMEGDIVIGVPDSSISASIGFSEEIELPYEIGLIKNRYVGRTFIEPTQIQREKGVRMKLSAVKSIVKGKRIFLIDDSIIRGTTIKRIIQILKEAGAMEVHVRIASAPFISPCFYGVDTSSYEELIASRLSVVELCEYIRADSLRFLNVEEMKEAFGTSNLCCACFDKKYVTPLYSYEKILKENKNE